ncbi:MAG TPA: hypothetical protein QGG37_09960 [Chloroflexota bacterium]|nr:hypothetical protein [Chloroflexota bacterium]
MSLLRPGGGELADHQADALVLQIGERGVDAGALGGVGATAVEPEVGGLPVLDVGDGGLVFALDVLDGFVALTEFAENLVANFVEIAGDAAKAAVQTGQLLADFLPFAAGLAGGGGGVGSGVSAGSAAGVRLRS